MCLPDFEKFDEISEDNPLIGYRNFLNSTDENNLELKSISQNYTWKDKGEFGHSVTERDSGIYAYNNYNNNYYNNNYNYYNYNNNNHNNYNYNYYNLAGIIFQFGRVAIHKIGQRSENAKLVTLFNIRISDAKGEQKFLDWIIEFNQKIDRIAKKYSCSIISWQDFLESQNK